MLLLISLLFDKTFVFWKSLKILRKAEDNIIKFLTVYIHRTIYQITSSACKGIFLSWFLNEYYVFLILCAVVAVK